MNNKHIGLFFFHSTDGLLLFLIVYSWLGENFSDKTASEHMFRSL